jgi:hypothetical protein
MTPMQIRKITRPPQMKTSSPDTFPSDLLKVDGLLGMIMAECIRSAPERRQPVYALAAALCTVGVLAGRRYRSESDLRTNVYGIILGESSSGKGHPQKVASRLIHEAGLSRYIGGEPASGTAIITELQSHPARLITVDEFGIWLAALTSPRAPKHLTDIKKRLMTLFSDASEIVQGVAYADQSKLAGRPREALYQPHLCLLGAGTPGHFFSALQSGAIRDGFIPRLLIFQPDEFYPARVLQSAPIVISADMVRAAQEIAGTVSVDGQNLAGIVPMASDIECQAICVPYDSKGRAEHEAQMQRREAIIQAGCMGFASKELVGKWAEHAIKLGMIRAISSNPAAPLMDRERVAWGWRVAEHCLRTVNAMAERHLADNETEASNKRVLNLITDAGPEGITAAKLTQATRFLNGVTRNQIVASLIDGQEIVPVALPQSDGGGRPGKRYVALAHHPQFAAGSGMVASKGGFCAHIT